MQDVFSESGLSAGAVNGYFRSKNELIAAVAEEALKFVTGAVRERLATTPPPPPAQAVRLLAIELVDFATRDGFDRTRVALSAWAASQRDPEVAALVRHVYGSMLRQLEVLAQAWGDAGQLPARADPRAVSRAFLGLMLGFLLQRLLLGDVEPDAYADGVDALLSSA